MAANEKPSVGVKRWQNQCFLIDGWKELAKRYCTKEYSSIIPISVHASEIVSILSAEPGAEIFFKLSPAQLSLLEPTIRLFIVDHDIAGGVHQESGAREIFFDDHMYEDNIGEILSSGRGRGRAAGIKSFSYTFDGGDPATVDKSITTRLKMIFTGVDAFTKPQESGVSYVDLVQRVRKMVPSNKERENADLSNPTSFCRKPKTKAEKKNSSPTTQNINPNYRRIRAQIGWAIPPDKTNEFVNSSFLNNNKTLDFKSFTKLLKRMQLNLFLEMTSHQMEFHNDGKLELSISYRGSIESDLLSEESNLFFDIQRQLLALQNRKSERVANVEKESMIAAEKEVEQVNKKIKGKDLIKKKTEIEKEAQAKVAKKKSEIQEQSQAQMDMLKYELYQSFLARITDNNLVQYVDVRKEDLIAWQGEELADSATKTDYAKKRKAGSASRTTADSILAKAHFGSGAGGGNAVTAMQKGLKDAVKEDTAKAAKKKILETKISTPSKGDGKVPKGHKRIYYLYFGDLINVAMDIFAENVDKTQRPVKVRAIISNLSFTDPATGEDTEVNICDLPVSLDEFIVWYKNNVISPGASTYHVLPFIKHLMTTLIGNALGASCFDEVGRSVAQLGIEYTQLAIPGPGKEPIPKSNGLFSRISSVGDLKKIVSNFSRSDRSDPTSYIDYIIIHASNNAPATMSPSKTITGNDGITRLADDVNGVYHLGIGLDRGIVKDIKFKANKMKYSDEANIVEKGLTNIGQLFTKYDADVTLWGCPLFKTGQYIYIDPKTMGVDAQMAALLGLGGYYMVYRVEGDLSSSGYFVTLSCKFQDSGICAGAASPRQIKAAPKEQSGAQRNQPNSTQAPPSSLIRKIDEMPSR